MGLFADRPRRAVAPPARSGQGAANADNDCGIFMLRGERPAHEDFVAKNVSTCKDAWIRGLNSDTYYLTVIAPDKQRMSRLVTSGR